MNTQLFELNFCDEKVPVLVVYRTCASQVLPTPRTHPIGIQFSVVVDQDQTSNFGITAQRQSLSRVHSKLKLLHLKTGTEHVLKAISRLLALKDKF